MHSIRLITIGLLGSMLTMSCSKTGKIAPVEGPIVVSIAATNAMADDRSESALTRTTISEDLKTPRWESTDRISLWATSDGGSSYALSNQVFTLGNYGLVYSTANFTATITPPAAGLYTYYAAYPIPESVNGTQLSYTLPSVQDGRYNGSSDLMVATPVSGEALTASAGQNISLDFNHLCHAFRIQVPQNKNLLGEAVSKLVVTFPQAVVGTASFDVTNPDGGLSLANASNIVTINLTEEKLDAQGRVVWLFIAPCTLNGESISFKAYSENSLTENIAVTLTKTLAAGHITPVQLTIPTKRADTYLDFTIGANHLGETVHTLTVTGPFPDGTQSKTMTLSGTQGSVKFFSDYEGDPASGQTFTASFESEHAIVSQSFTMPSLQREGRTAISLTVPYLMEENFASISDFSNNDNDGVSPSNPSAVTLDGSGLTGWTGARVGGGVGASVRVTAHSEGAGAFCVNYNGRLDSPAITTIKNGRNVNVKVSFTYGFNRSGTSANARFNYGYTTTSGALKGDNEEGTFNGSITASAHNASYTSNISTTQEFTISECTNAHRLSWLGQTSRSGWSAGNYNFWTYIDNVKVWIIP